MPLNEREFELKFKPNPIQRAFIRSRARADMWASRMGEGKSAGLAWAAYYYARHNPGAAWGMVRDTWENLRATTQEEFFKWFPPGVFGTYHHTNKEFTWAEGVAKGKIVWFGMDDPEDVSKLQSRKIDGFGMDEVAPALNSGGVPETVFDVALSRARDPGMNWYPVKLVTNNPDETHWTYRRFVEPGEEGFRWWQAETPENEGNLKPGYYSDLRRMWAHRPEFVKRFVDGKFGFVSAGHAVTPQWNDVLHLAIGLYPIKGIELYCLWDFGLTPVCIVTQVTPLGQWNFIDCFTAGDEQLGVAELVESKVKPVMRDKYRGFELRHIGDPAGMQREQSSSKQSAVRMILKTLGGKWRSGPKSISEGVEPLRAVLSRLVGGQAVVQVDRANARDVWMALRGGWHFHVSRTGVVSRDPAKTHPDSDVGDACRYGAGVLFPLALPPRARRKRGQHAGQGRPASYFGAPGQKPGLPAEDAFRITKYHSRVPKHGEKL